LRLSQAAADDALISAVGIALNPAIELEEKQCAAYFRCTVICRSADGVGIPASALAHERESAPAIHPKRCRRVVIACKDTAHASRFRVRSVRGGIGCEAVVFAKVRLVFAADVVVPSVGPRLGAQASAGYRLARRPRIEGIRRAIYPSEVS